jgi:hypothetical protein
MNIVIGIIGVILSILLIIYRAPVKHFIGNIDWAEQKLGPGGTYTLLLLLGVVGFFVSLTIMTGTLDVFLGSVGKQFFGGGK